MPAIEGKEGLPNALFAAVRHRQAKSLLLLLMVGGYEKRSMRANAVLDGKPLIHYGAGYCCAASVSALLAAGSDETNRDSKGRMPWDAIGVNLEQDELRRLDRGQEVTVRRVLLRGPAFRAQS